MISWRRFCSRLGESLLNILLRVLSILNRVAAAMAYVAGAVLMLASFYITVDVLSGRFLGVSSGSTDEFGGPTVTRNLDLGTPSTSSVRLSRPPSAKPLKTRHTQNFHLLHRSVISRLAVRERKPWTGWSRPPQESSGAKHGAFECAFATAAAPGDGGQHGLPTQVSPTLCRSSTQRQQHPKAAARVTTAAHGCPLSRPQFYI